MASPWEWKAGSADLLSRSAAFLGRKQTNRRPQKTRSALRSRVANGEGIPGDGRIQGIPCGVAWRSVRRNGKGRVSVSLKVWMQTNQRADAGWRLTACRPDLIG